MANIHDANFISKLCYEFYEKRLLKNGKPVNNEWTTLSAVILNLKTIQDLNKKFKIVSLATGSKCLPMKDLPLDGSLVHDSHSEVLARRGFIRYAFNELNRLKNEKSYKSDAFEVVENDQNKQFKVKENVEFYLFCSHTPCGDASIIPKLSNENEKNKQEEKEDDEFIGEPQIKKLKTDEINDIHRTGAKCVPSGSLQDTKEKGINYHTLKAIRIKPGRGDPTISMSCSDKLAKWLAVGIQGSLLGNFLKQPIYLDAIILGRCPYSQESMIRALIERSVDIKNLPDGYKCHKPCIIQSEIAFKDSKAEKLKILKDESKLNACPTSICWSNVNKKETIVLVKGNLLGVTHKNSNKPKPKSAICKYKFLESFCNLYENFSNKQATYEEIKNLNKTYKNAIKAFLNVYSDWICTDASKYYQFKLDNK